MTEKKSKEPTHGLSKHPLYQIHVEMRGRTTRPEHPEYHRYGGRGITLDPALLNIRDFITYVNTKLGPRPSHRHSIDRVDNNLGYKPGNLRWATYEEQAYNKRNNKHVIHNGVARRLQDICRETGISRSALHSRLKRGWDLDKALGTPVKPPRHRKTLSIGEEARTFTEWASRSGVQHLTIRQRIKRGWSAIDAISTPTGRKPSQGAAA